MTVRLSELLDAFESLWPAAGAESWDAPGLVCGSVEQPVSRVLLTVDVTKAVLDEAIDGGFDLIVAHHPYIMRGVTTLQEQSVKGALLSRAIRHGVAIFAAHTNADIVETGVSAALAKAFGLVEVRPLVGNGMGTNVGHGRIGKLATEMSLEDFAVSIGRVLPSTVGGIRVAGQAERMVRTIALCGGAGDSFIGDAIEQGAEVYVTSDLRHHVTQDVKERAELGLQGPALIDISHWAAESIWLGTASAQIAGIFEGLQIVASQLRTDPWDFVVTQ